jgi:hypothetical protein
MRKIICICILVEGTLRYATSREQVPVCIHDNWSCYKWAYLHTCLAKCIRKPTNWTLAYTCISSWVAISVLRVRTNSNTQPRTVVGITTIRAVSHAPIGGVLAKKQSCSITHLLTHSSCVIGVGWLLLRTKDNTTSAFQISIKILWRVWTHWYTPSRWVICKSQWIDRTVVNTSTSRIVWVIVGCWWTRWFTSSWNIVGECTVEGCVGL